jgi:hypothetical protein
MAGRPGAEQAQAARPGTTALSGLLWASMAAWIMLLVQLGIGVAVSLSVSVPAADRGHGIWTAIGRALSHGPAVLAVHAGVGLLLLVTAVNVLVRALIARHRTIIATSAVALIAIAGAAFSGAAFVDAGHAAASLSMTILTVVALLCYLVSLFVVGRARRDEAAP